MSFSLHSKHMIHFIISVHLCDEISLQSLRSLITPVIKHPEEKLVKVMCSFNGYFYFSSFILFHYRLVVGWPKGKHKSVFWKPEMPTLTVQEYLVMVATMHTLRNRPSQPMADEWCSAVRVSSLAIDYSALILFCFWSNAKAIHLATRKQCR